MWQPHCHKALLAFWQSDCAALDCQVATWLGSGNISWEGDAEQLQMEDGLRLCKMQDLFKRLNNNK